jgi:hypothetical protein
MTSNEELQDKWKIRWPNLQDSISRLIGAALTAVALICAGWALQRNDALGIFATFATVAGSSLIAGLFRPERKNFDDLDPRSLRGQLVEWARDYGAVRWLVSPTIWRAFGGVGFGLLVAVLETWVHTWFGEDPAHPTLGVTLATLAIVLIPAFTWTGYLAEQRFGRSAKVDELGAIFTERINIAWLSSPLGRASVLAVVRTGVAIALRVVAIWVLPMIFNTQQATIAVACFLAIIVVYHDTISDSITKGPKALRLIQKLTAENRALTEQIATLRAQVAVLQGTAGRPRDEGRSEIDPA